MLYYCRGCSTPLVTGWENCKNCGYLFDKIVPEFVGRETYNAHKITYWPPRKPTALELFLMDIWGWLGRAPIAVKLLATLLIVGLLVYKGVTDAQQAGIPADSPSITVSTEGDSSYAAQTAKMASGLGSGSSDGSGSSEATGDQGTSDEDPNAPLSEDEADFVRRELHGMASDVGTPGVSASAIVPDDPPATQAAAGLTQSEKSELQDQLNSVADSAAAEVAPAPKKAAATTASAPKPQAAANTSSQENAKSGSGQTQGGHAPAPSSQPGASNGSSQDSSKQPASAQEGKTTSNESPSGQPNGAANQTAQTSHSGTLNIVLHPGKMPLAQAERMMPTRRIRIVIYRGPSRALSRMRYLYRGARQRYIEFMSSQNDQQYVLSHASESNAIQNLVHQGVVVYPRLYGSERLEWKRDVIAMLVWKIEMGDIVKVVQAINAPSTT